jgi:N-acetylmuramoyl-L-alanine amidase
MTKIFKLLVLVFFNIVSSVFCEVPFLDASVKRDKKIIMINPAGHAGDAGRKLKNSNERAEAFKMAQYFQSELEKGNDEVRVVLTRAPGETIVDFQNASFANRLGKVDLFISLHCYWEEGSKPKLFVYHYISDPVADFSRRNIPELSFVPVLQAHQFNASRTKNIAQRFQQAFNSTTCIETFDFGGLFGIPVKPLLGIAAPAILIEIGWPQGECDNWNDVANLIAARIGEFF